MSSEPSKRNNLFTMLHRSLFFSLRITLSIFPYLFIPYMYEKLRSSFVFFILPFSIIYWLDMIYFLVRGRGFDTKWYFYIYIYLYINEWIAFIVYIFYEFYFILKVFFCSLRFRDTVFHLVLHISFVQVSAEQCAETWR